MAGRNVPLGFGEDLYLTSYMRPECVSSGKTLEKHLIKLCVKVKCLHINTHKMRIKITCSKTVQITLKANIIIF